MWRSARSATFHSDVCRTMSDPLPVCLPCKTLAKVQMSCRISKQASYTHTALYNEPIKLEELADDGLPLWFNCKHLMPNESLDALCNSLVVPTSSPPSCIEHALCDVPTFIICNSLSPFCIRSCFIRSSVTTLCSRKASLVRRFAYSLKLYAENCLDWRRRERYWMCRGLTESFSTRSIRRGSQVT